MDKVLSLTFQTEVSGKVLGLKQTVVESDRVLSSRRVFFLISYGIQLMASTAAIPPFDFCISILGSGGVGKTSLLRSFFEQNFNERHVPTLDDYYVHTMAVDGTHFTVCFVDTAGSYSFPVMRKLALDSSQGYIVVYALDNVASFQEAVQTMEEISAHRGNSDGLVPVILVGNKLDIDVNKREVTARQGHGALSVLLRLDGEYIETSAKTDFRVEKVFMELIRTLIYNARELNKKRLPKSRRKGHRGKGRKFKARRRSCSLM